MTMHEDDLDSSRPLEWLDAIRFLAFGCLLLGLLCAAVALFTLPEATVFVRAVGLAALALSVTVAASLTVIAWRD